MMTKTMFSDPSITSKVQHVCWEKTYKTVCTGV